MMNKNIFFLGLLLLVPAFMNASQPGKSPAVAETNREDIRAGEIVIGTLELTNMTALFATAGSIIKNNLYPSLINTPKKLAAPLLFVRNNSTHLFTTATIAAAIQNRLLVDKARRALDIATGINSFGWGGYILREYGSHRSTLIKSLGFLTTGLLWTSGIYAITTPEQKKELYEWLNSKQTTKKNY